MIASITGPMATEHHPSSSITGPMATEHHPSSSFTATCPLVLSSSIEVVAVSVHSTITIAFTSSFTDPFDRQLTVG